MKFTKMHGAGNDYIYVNAMKEQVLNPSEVAIRISDRHFGIGSDGLVLIMDSDCADFRMRMFNSDGSESEMCGNASRCIGKYVFDKGLTDKHSVTLETKAGIKVLDLTVVDGKVTTVRVDMGEPILEPVNIPMDFPGDYAIQVPVVVRGKEYLLNGVSMGNPHAVIFTEGIEALNLPDIGPDFEHNELFPKRTNTEFVEVVDNEHVKMRVWERGAGETLACGTGACAVLVAGVLSGHLHRKAQVDLLGGTLQIEWNAENNHVYMTGDAVTVFEGEILF
ncbi:MAG TPA: diaminopimelate epimerase [Bacteroidales bacterium]|nr:diaminopimelate epimerase [Bacteroidales bacterium]